MKNRLKPLLTFFGLLMIIIIVSLVPELVGGDLADALKKVFSDKYFLVIGGIGVITVAAYTYWSEGDRIFSSKSKHSSPENVSQDNLHNIRASLLASYQQRIDSKLASRFPVNIEVVYTREGSPTKGHLYNKSLRVDELKKELIEIFDKQHGRLLIIGEPGAGKTTLLLQLAIKLLERGETQIPFLINIATWRTRFSSVEEWIMELLPQMGFSKALAKQMIAEQRLLLLFDGLDEVAHEERSVFLNTVANYGKSNQVRFVICSRIQEYTDTVDAAVNGQVMVKPLTLTQIEQGLKETASPEANGLLDAMKKDPLFATALMTPFYLNTAQLLFASKKTWEEFEFISSETVNSKQVVIAAFVNDATNKLGNYSREQGQKWLAFLASRMNRDSLVVLELTSLQYDWNKLNKMQVLFRDIIYAIVSGLALGLISGLIAGLIAGFVVGLIGGLVSALMYGLVYDQVNGQVSDKIEDQAEIITMDKINWPVSLLRYILKYTLIGGLGGLILGLVSGLVLGLIASLISGYLVPDLALNLVAGGLFLGLFLGPASGLTWGLLLGLFEMLKNTQSYLKTTHPYQRFYASMWSLHFSILQHFHLRRILYKKDLLPWRLVDFLNEATKNNILESDGGSWRFRHRILQDYFAKHWEDVYAETEDGHQKQEEG